MSAASERGDRGMRVRPNRFHAPGMRCEGGGGFWGRFMIRRTLGRHHYWHTNDIDKASYEEGGAEVDWRHRDSQ